MLHLHLAAPSALAPALGALAGFLAAHPPASPLRPIPVLVDAPTHEAWVRTWLAHHDQGGISAGLAVAPAATAIEGLLARAAGRGQPSWWLGPRADDPWSAPALTAKILAVWAAHPDEPALERLRAYVSDHPRGEVRRVLLAERAAQRLRDAMATDAAAVLGWRERSEPSAPDRWFRFTLRHLDLGSSPAHARAHPTAADLARVVGPSLALVGLAAADAATVGLLQSLATACAVCWIRPSTALGMPAAPRSSSSARAQALELRRRAAVGEVAETHPDADEPRSDTLAAWRTWVTGAPAAPGTPRPEADGRLPQLLPAWTPRREVEQLREQLLRHFDLPDAPGSPRSGLVPALAGLEPRDVRVLTPDLATYGPLLLEVFSQSHDASEPLPPFPPDDPPDGGERGTPAKRAPKEKVAQPTAVPAIPLQLVGLGLTATNPVAGALLGALDALTDRLTLPHFFALVSIPQVRRRFGLGHVDPERLRTLLRDSGARWGFDGQDRGAVYGGDHPVHSVAFGLERLALGALVHDELDPAKGELPTRWGPDDRLLFPSQVASRAELTELASLQIVFETLRTWRERLRVGPTGEETWPALLGRFLDELVSTGGSTRFLQQQVSDAIAEALPANVPLRVQAVAALLRDRFDRPVPGDAQGLPGVQVASLEEANALPARLVVLLGMNSGTFPRRDDRPAWMPAGNAPALPERDRQAFTAAVLAARHDVWITWTARESRRGEEIPPGSLVEDLIDGLALSTDPKEEAARRHGVQQPWGRHRWSPRAQTTYSRAIAAAGVAAQARASAPARASFGVPLPDPQVGGARPGAEPRARTMSLEELAKRLLNPSRTLLWNRLGVWIEEQEDELADHDPLVLGPGLPTWKVRDALLRWRLGGGQGTAQQALLDAFVGTGLFPDGPPAAWMLQSHLALVDDLVATYEAAGRKGRSETLRSDPVALRVGDVTVRLTGTLPDCVVGPTTTPGGREVRMLRHVLVSNVKKPKHLLAGWLRLLFANAQESGPPVASIQQYGVSGAKLVQRGLSIRPAQGGLWHGESDPVPPIAVRDQDVVGWLDGDPRRHARDWLTAMVRLALDGERMALPLFPEASYEAVDAVVTWSRKAKEKRSPDLRSLVALAAGDAWASRDAKDPFVAALHPRFDLEAHVRSTPQRERPPAEPIPSEFLPASLPLWWPIALADHSLGQHLEGTPLLSWSQR